MTEERFKECLRALHWSKRGLAVILGTHETTIRRWADGTQAMPLHVADWLDASARAMEAAPLPVGWERRGN